jgi:tetratricopeptide (TPR) repeat protein
MTDRQTALMGRESYKEGCKLMRAGKLLEAATAFTWAIDRKARVADAYFRRGVCHYLLGTYRMAVEDIRAAALLGCKDAQLWGLYDIQPADDAEYPSDLFAG